MIDDFFHAVERACRREGVAFDIVSEDIGLEKTDLEDEDEDGSDDASR